MNSSSSSSLPSFVRLGQGIIDPSSLRSIFPVSVDHSELYLRWKSTSGGPDPATISFPSAEEAEDALTSFLREVTKTSSMYQVQTIRDQLDLILRIMRPLVDLVKPHLQKGNQESPLLFSTLQYVMNSIPPPGNDKEENEYNQKCMDVIGELMELVQEGKKEEEEEEDPSEKEEDAKEDPTHPCIVCTGIHVDGCPYAVPLLQVRKKWENLANRAAEEYDRDLEVLRNMARNKISPNEAPSLAFIPSIVQCKEERKKKKKKRKTVIPDIEMNRMREELQSIEKEDQQVILSYFERCHGWHRPMVRKIPEMDHYPPKDKKEETEDSECVPFSLPS